jgi:hypothetical protein
MDADTERHVATVKRDGKDVTYYIRELGYYEFQEINQDAALEYPSNKERRGLSVLHRTAVAAIEDEDGNPVFTPTAWKRLKKEPATELTYKVMLAQGIDLKSEAEEPDQTGQENESGNG